MSNCNAGPTTISIEGLEVFAHHGVSREEKELGQFFIFDISLKVGECPARESDEITETVDYALVADNVVRAATTNTYSLLERLASVVAREILDVFPVVDSVRVRVAKKAPPLPHSVDGVATVVEYDRNMKKG